MEGRAKRWVGVLLRYGGAAAAVVLASLVANLTDPVLPATTLLLAAIVVVSWFWGMGPGLLASALATLDIEFYFTAPFTAFTPRIEQAARLVVFALLAVLSGWGSSVRKKAERSLREARDELEERVRARTAQLARQASLLDLTHDTVMVRDMAGMITFWNRGAEEQYGWTREEAVGKVAHDLLMTVFPAPRHDIATELRRTGRWEGELVQTRRDGTEIVVASRWALQSDSDGAPLAVLETTNDVTERKRTERALEDLAGRLIHAQEEERSRIGRELHDHISQMLGVLSIRIDQLGAADGVTPEIAEALDELRQSTSEVTDDVHRLSHRLHSSTLDYLGLAPALQKLVAEVSGRHDISIDFVHTPLPALPSEVALCLFRVAEESLTNIVKHSRASSARVEVNAASDGIHLRIDDTGTGFDVTRLGRSGGLGFVSMQERLRVVHGTIRIDSNPARGTTIDVWVPVVTVATGSESPVASIES